MQTTRHGFANLMLATVVGATMAGLMGGCPGSSADAIVPLPDASGADHNSGQRGSGGNLSDNGSGTVQGQNLPPAAASLQISTARNADACIQLSADDPEGTALTFFVVTNPAHGTVTGTPPELVYTPAAGYVGSDSFTYVASDGLLQSSAAIVTVDVRAPRNADGGPIDSGETVSGTIDSGSDSDAWTFSGAAGQIFRMRCTRISGQWTPAIYLFPPGGGDSLTSTNAAGYSWAELDYQLETSGVYTIVIEDFPGTGAGEYTLSMINVSEPSVPAGATDGGPIRSAQTRSGLIGLQGEIDAYTFSGLAGQTVRIRVTKTDCRAWTPAIWLVPAGGGNGVTVTSGNDSWGQLDYQLEITGNYTILVEDYSGPGIGAYNLSLLNLGAELTSAEDTDGGQIIPGLPRAGRIDLPGDIDAFVFSGAAGQNVRIRLTRHDKAGWTPALWIFAPGSGGFVLSTTAGGSETAQLNYRLEATGVFTIVVEDYSGAGVGDYTLALEQF